MEVGVGVVHRMDFGMTALVRVVVVVVVVVGVVVVEGEVPEMACQHQR